MYPRREPGRKKRMKYDYDIYHEHLYRSPGTEYNRSRKNTDWAYDYFDYEERTNKEQVYNFENPQYYDSFIYGTNSVYEYEGCEPEDVILYNDELESPEMYNRDKRKKEKRKKKNSENKHLQKHSHTNSRPNNQKRRGLSPSETMRRDSNKSYDQDYNVYLSQTVPLRFDQQGSLSLYSDSRRKTKTSKKYEQSPSRTEKQPQYEIYNAELGNQMTAGVFNQKLKKESPGSFMSVTSNANYPILLSRDQIGSLLSNDVPSPLGLAYMPVLFVPDKKDSKNAGNQQNNLQDNNGQGVTDKSLLTYANVYTAFNGASNNVFNHRQSNKTELREKPETDNGSDWKLIGNNYSLESYLLTTNNGPNSKVTDSGNLGEGAGDGYMHHVNNQTRGSEGELLNTKGKYDQEISISGRNNVYETIQNESTGLNKDSQVLDPSTFKITTLGNAMSRESYANLPAMPKTVSSVQIPLPALVKVTNKFKKNKQKSESKKNESINTLRNSKVMNKRSMNEETSKVSSGNFSNAQSNKSVIYIKDGKQESGGTLSKMEGNRQMSQTESTDLHVSNKSLQKQKPPLTKSQNITSGGPRSVEDGTTLVINITENMPGLEGGYSQIPSEGYLTNESNGPMRATEYTVGQPPPTSRSANLNGSNKSFGTSKGEPQLFTRFIRKEEQKDKIINLDKNIINPYSGSEIVNKASYNQNQSFTKEKSMMKATDSSNNDTYQCFVTGVSAPSIIDKNMKKSNIELNHDVDDLTNKKSKKKSSTVTNEEKNGYIEAKNDDSLQAREKTYVSLIYTFEIAKFVVGVSFHEKLLEITQFLL